jgi:hypothetical protein
MLFLCRRINTDIIIFHKLIIGVDESFFFPHLNIFRTVTLTSVNSEMDTFIAEKLSQSVLYIYTSMIIF